MSDYRVSVAVEGGTHTFRWGNEGLEGGCGGTNFDDVTVTVGSIGTPPAATFVRGPPAAPPLLHPSKFPSRCSAISDSCGEKRFLCPPTPHQDWDFNRARRTHIVKYDHCASHVAMPIMNRGGSVFDRGFPPIPTDRKAVLADADTGIALNRQGQWIPNGFSAVRVDDPHHFLQRSARRLPH